MSKQKHKNTRMAGIPYITGVITYGQNDRSIDCFKLDGPLDKEMEKILKKYGKPLIALPLLISIITCYGAAWMMAGAMIFSTIL